MKYATTYDIGKRKRQKGGINEDSIAVTLIQDGHREGLDIDGDSDDRADDESDGPTVHGPGDEIEQDGGTEGIDASEKDGSENTEGSDDADNLDREDSGIGVNEETTEVYPAGGDIPTASDPVERAGPRDRYAGIFVLADGAGGEEAGDLASYIATTVITEELSGFIHRARRFKTGGFGLEIDEDAFGESPSDEEIETEIANAVEEANREIIRYVNDAGLEGSYSTVVVGVYLDDKFYYGWVGDSRAYVVNEAHGEISLLTKDHAKVQRYEDEGKIDEIEAHVHPDGNEIDRAIGGRAGTDPESVHSGVETGVVPLYREDIVIITSDGLIDAQTDYRELYQEYVTSNYDEEVGARVLEEVVTDSDILDIVLEEPTLEDAAEQFVDFSNEKGGKDNISLILFSGSALPKSPDPSESALPERALDPDTELKERGTVIKD